MIGAIIALVLGCLAIGFALGLLTAAWVERKWRDADSESGKP